MSVKNDICNMFTTVYPSYFNVFKLAIHPHSCILILSIVTELFYLIRIMFVTTCESVSVGGSGVNLSRA